MISLLISLLLLWGGEPERRALPGVVLDRQDRKPLPFAHIVLLPENKHVMADDKGRFVLVAGRESIARVSMTGFTSREVMLSSHVISDTLRIYLEASPFQLNEVLISARHAWDGSARSHQAQTLAPVEQFLEQLDGVNMIKRAHYAWEPSVRGMQTQRMNVVLDGVTMVAACVDGMDPVTSYIDTENLSKVLLDKGNTDFQHGSRPGGSLELLMTKPEFGKGFQTEVQSGAMSNGAQQKYRIMTAYSGEHDAAQVALSYRNAQSIKAGEGLGLGHSGFNKLNLKADYGRHHAANVQGWFTYVGDVAWDIGYPALLMDTERAQSHLLAYEVQIKPRHAFISKLRLKPYHTRIDHSMDDYKRDVTARAIMKNMYMPMVGNTRTSGVRLDVEGWRQDQSFSFHADIHYFSAFADMEMQPLDDGVSPMYLQNLGHLGFWNGFASLSHTWLLPFRMSVDAAVNGTFSLRNLQNEFARHQMEGIHPGVQMNQHRSVINGKLGLHQHHGTHHGWSVNVSTGNRLPSHIESYGYYIYSPLFDAFFYGNPSLPTERNWNVNLSGYYEMYQGLLRFEASLYHNQFRNYISMERIDPLFAVYRSFRSAYIRGMEWNATWKMSQHWQYQTSFSLIDTQNETLNEPLPMIAPAEWRHNLRYSTSSGTMNLGVRQVQAQRKVSVLAAREQSTKGFIVVDVHGSRALSNRLTLHGGVENVMDVWYVEHTSPGRMPSMGRNVYVQLKWTL